MLDRSSKLLTIHVQRLITITSDTQNMYIVFQLFPQATDLMASVNILERSILLCLTCDEALHSNDSLRNEIFAIPDTYFTEC